MRPQANPWVDLPLRLLAKSKLSVFLFHKVPRDYDPLVPLELTLATFERMLDNVLAEFNVISLDDAVVALNQDKLPPRAACITFDDGYPDWIKGAVPALLRRNMHATFFINTCQFQGRPLWHEQINALVRNSKKRTVDLGVYEIGHFELDDDASKVPLITAIETLLKYQQLEKREEIFAHLRNLLDSNLEAVPIMSLEDLKAMHAKGFGIGAHTVNHPILSCCNDDIAWTEIAQVKEELSGLINAPVTAFAYPNGRPNLDFNHRHVEMVKKAGYTCAVTTEAGVIAAGGSAYQIPRFTPWAESQTKLAAQLVRNILKKPTIIGDF